MKKSTLFFLLLVSSLSNAQTGLTSYSNPPGLQIGTSTFYNGNELDCDPLGNAWVAFFNKGIGKFDGTSWTVFDTSNSAIRTNIVNAISHDHQNYLWLATDSGLGRFDGISSWTWYDSTNSILGSSRIKNVYALGNKLLLKVSYTLTILDSFYTFNTATGIFQPINVVPLVGLTKVHYKCLRISPQGNLYMGSSNLKKIIKVDGSGNQTLIDLNPLFISSISGPLQKCFFDIDNTEKIWLSHKVFLDTALVVQTVQSCPSTPEALLAFGYPLGNLDCIRRDYQNIPWLARGSSITFLNANPWQHYVFPTNQVPTNGFKNIITAPSGEVWLFGPVSATIGLHKFNPAIYSYAAVDSTLGLEFLDINEVVTSITPICDMHWNPFTSQGPQYAVPKCSGVSSVFSSALWLGGLDALDTLHVAAQTYRQDGLDFWPGPLDTLSASIDSVTSAAYNHVWKINRSDIVNFIYQYSIGNVTSLVYPVPPDFLSWPAHGTGNFSRNLAPFVDYNSDGLYDPYDGDYPKIKGDQMLYSIFNDVLYPHTETGGRPFGFEFHKSSYASVCPLVADSDRVMNYTTYYEYEIFNRSDTTYHDMYIGVYCDVDLGNYLDDYVGCDTMLHAGFVYNGDNDDEGFNGYGLNPPIQNVTILDSPEAIPGDGMDNDHDGTTDEAGEKSLMSNFVIYDNNFTFTGNPENALHYYNYLKSLWKNSMPILGCDSLPTHYTFSGTPYDTTQCNETLPTNMPHDRRFLISSGPFTLPAHGKTSITFAYVWTRDELNPNGINTSIARNRSDLMKIRQWFAADTIPSCLQLFPGVEENSQLKPLFNLYPNPADETLNIQYAAQSMKPLYRIHDTAGRLLKSGKLKENISTVNLSSFIPGNYIFEITDGNIKTTKSFVKQ